MNLKRWLILLAIIVFYFGQYQVNSAEAATLDTVLISFDRATLARGYTVKSIDKQLWIPITPHLFNDKLVVKVNEKVNYSIIPEDKTLVGKVYHYDLVTNNILDADKEILLSMAVPTGVSTNEELFYYDDCNKQWVALDSKIDEKKGIVQAKTNLHSADIAVFAGNPNSLTAEAAIVINGNSGDIVYQKNIGDVRSIASLSKLMTTLVFLDHNPGWDKVVTMQKSDNVGGASLWVKDGTKLTVTDLFNAMLVGSKNNAVMALVRSTGLTNEKFVKAMNEKAKELGLTHTYFVEPTGLSEKNVSTAEELSIIAEKVFKNEKVYKATTTKLYKVRPVGSTEVFPVNNTSIKVLSRDLEITGTKTGWTDEAGYCLVSQAKKDDKELIALVLGAKITKNYEEVYNLLKKYL